MPTLHWIGKENVMNHQRDVPFRVLEHQYGFFLVIKEKPRSLKAEQYAIYADNCLHSKEFMAKHHIMFKKIPRDITKF